MKDIRDCPSPEQGLDIGLAQFLDPPRIRFAFGQRHGLDRGETPRGLPDAQADQADRGAPVEDHHQDEALRDYGEVHVVPLPLVEKDGEFLLPDEVGEPPGGGDVPRGERGQGSRVESDGIPRGCDEGTVLVDQEDDLREGVRQQLPQDREERLVLRLPEDEVSVAHRREDTTCSPDLGARIYRYRSIRSPLHPSLMRSAPLLPIRGVPKGANFIREWGALRSP